MDSLPEALGSQAEAAGSQAEMVDSHRIAVEEDTEGYFLQEEGGHNLEDAPCLVSQRDLKRRGSVFVFTCLALGNQNMYTPPQWDNSNT